MTSYAFALLPFVIALGVAVASLVLRARTWRAGLRFAEVDIVGGLRALPRRYLVDVHAVVARRHGVARMHVLAAGGFLTSAIVALLAITGWLSGPVGIALVMASAAAGFGGALIDRQRRTRQPGDALSHGPYARLSGRLMLALAYLLIAGVVGAAGWLPALPSPIVVVLFISGLAVLVPIAIVSGGNPLRHAFAGALHLAWHPRPKRFGATGSDTALRPLSDVGAAAPKLGADRVGDFAWNELLGFDACVQCGRCEEACPAFAAGLPLNPKKFVNDIAGAMAPTAYSGSPHPGIELVAARGPVLLGAGGAVAPATLWSCTTCRACVASCPMMIEHVDAVIDLRRFATMEQGAVPGKAPSYLTALHEADTPSGQVLASRLDFASDLDLPVAKAAVPFDVLLWIGEGGFDLRNQRSLRALIGLLREAKVDFAVLQEECDCGDTARRLGDEATFQRLAKANVAALNELTFGRIVTSDPHVAHCLGREYPALGGRYEVSHHTTFLASLADRGLLRLTPGPRHRLTYHDPCYLGRYLGETDAPRRLLDGLGATRVEMARHGRNSFCCGGGGGAPLTDIQGRRRIPDLRMGEARATGAETLVVACPTCTIMLEGVAQPRPAVQEIAEVLLAALDRSTA